jgi:transcriptional regulator with XRE-family HTH domain
MTMKASSLPTDLTPKHVRAARALLAWSQQDLAKKASVATSTVADFERGHRTPVANNAQAIRGALESAGIRFLPTGAIFGPPIPRIAASDRPRAPIRWVDAEDLADWANRMDGAVSLPTLLASLIRATQGPTVGLRFPSDEGVRHPGWDGHTIADQAGAYVPQGEAGWEIGSQRSNIAQKATEDYRKRTQEPGPLNPANATYIFVTPRHWPKKDEWAKDRRAEGAWRDVRVYDADDLVHWIEQTPAVGLWLATRLGKRPAGTRQIEEVWEEWSLATQWPLTEDLVLSDRDEDAAEILRWLRGEPSALSIQATTTDEVVAFLHATLSMLPDEVAAHYRARCLVATDAAAARALANAPAPQIIVLAEPDPGIARSLADRGHFVLQAYDDRPVSRGEVRKLARPSREGIASALIGAGIVEPRARALARDSARNLAILRRLIPSAPGRLPAWAQEPPPRALLAALLAGGWDDASEADKVRVSELAGEPYDQVVAELVHYVGEFDSPLRKVGTTWRVASPPDAWLLLAPYLTAGEVERFESVAHAVLGSIDPRFDMDPSDRWMASVKGVHPDHSELLRHGVGEVLILLALWGDKIRTVPDARRRAEAIVGKLLRNADQRRWWSLSRNFRLLAEASPKAFLSAIEDSLDQNDPPIRALFGSDEGGLFGAEHLSDLLWALESLAWSPELLPRVTLVLARLDAIDNPPGRNLNRPANSLRQIHLLWLPQTYATLDQRLRTLDLIRKLERNAAWKLMLGVLPQGHDTSTPSPLPRWRDFTVEKVEPVTWPLIGRGAAAISERLLADVGLDAVRWQLLLDRLGDIAPDREAVLAALEATEPKIKNKADRAAIWERLRQLLHHHRMVPDANWAMPSEDLDRIERIYDRFAPSDPLEQVAWLFEPPVSLPRPSHEGWQAEERDVDDARRRAALSVFASHGASGILNLARLASSASYIGKALFDAGVSGADLDSLVEAAVRSDDQRERDLAHGLIISVFLHRREPWAEALLAKARDKRWGDTAVLTILQTLPPNRWTWHQAAQASEAIETAYWRRVPVFWTDDSEAATFAVRKLISVGRARHALHMAGRDRNAQLPSDLLVEVLKEAASQPFKNDDDGNEPTMFQYHVSEVFNQLDRRSDVDNDTLVGLEWTYLPVLEHSRRPAKVLLKALSERPSLFVEMVSAIYKPSEESGVVDPLPPDRERAQAIAHQAYRLLKLWNRLPGTQEDGTIDGTVLEMWIKDARGLAKAAGREDVADSRIGTMLSASPVGSDGTWPAEAVRDVIDLFRSKPMIEGFWVGKSNRRGVTTRMPRDGGALERNEGAQYRKWAAAIVYDYPYTAKALDALAESYEHQAHREDEDAERLDWGL